MTNNLIHMKTYNKLRWAVVAACLLMIGSAPPVWADIKTGLIGHWKFDETSGTSALDSSGQGHNGTVYNLVGDDPGWIPGKVNGALTFRGPDQGSDAVIVSELPALMTTFSVSAWVWNDPRDGTWPESAIVKSSGITSGGPLGLVIRLKNRDQAFGPLGNTSVDAGGIVVVNDTVGFPVDVWQHVGVVADGSRIRLYRNGIEVASDPYVPPFQEAVAPQVGIGFSPDDGGALGAAFWQGKIDDVGVWTVALTAGQMTSIFNAGQAGKDLTQADAYQNLPPTITTQPVAITRFVGETASFSVQAAGTGTLSYQWKLDGNPVAGATGPVYGIASVKESDAGLYTVVVSNAAGTVESQPARLTVQAVTISSGLIGYWKLDEQQGDTAADSTTNQLHATLFNYPGDNSQWVAGKVGGAVAIAGADLQQFLIVPDYPKPTSTLTVSAWVWAETLGSWATFVKNWGSTDAGQFHFGLFGDGIYENIYIKQADGKTPNVSDPAPFPTGSWQHVAFVCDGSMVRLYRNGSEVASTTYDGTLVNPPMSCVGIGAKIADDCTYADMGAPGWFKGKMDDVAIWNRGISAAEMVAIYQGGLQGKGVLEADVTQVFPPSFTAYSTNVAVFEGTLVTLSATATGTPPLAFQWYKEGQALAGQTNATLPLGAATLAMAGNYRVGVSNSAGAILSDVIVVAVQARPPATLVSEWKFETNLQDTSSLGNHGVAFGTVEYVPGISGSAVRLAAANPVVCEGAQGLPLAGTDSWSLNLWLKLSVPPKSLSYLAGFGPVLDVGGGTARSLLAFSGAQDNNIYVWGSSADTPTASSYPLNRWAMVTVTHDGADGTTAVYLDGQHIGQNVAPGTDVPADQNRISLAPTSNWNVDTAGDFDEFTLWKGVLNPSQIADLHALGAPPALTVRLEGSQVTLSWPASATGYTLQTTTSLVGGTWANVPGVAGTSVTLPVGTANAFFRLIK